MVRNAGASVRWLVAGRSGALEDSTYETSFLILSLDLLAVPARHPPVLPGSDPLGTEMGYSESFSVQVD